MTQVVSGMLRGRANFETEESAPIAVCQLQRNWVNNFGKRYFLMGETGKT